MSKEIGIIGNAEVVKPHLADIVKERGITFQELIQEDKSFPISNPYIEIEPIIYSDYTPSYKKSKHHNRKYKNNRVKNRLARKSRKINRK